MNKTRLHPTWATTLLAPVIALVCQPSRGQLPDPYNPYWADGFDPGTYDYEGDYVDKWVEPLETEAMEPEREEWQDIYNDYVERDRPATNPRQPSSRYTAPQPYSSPQYSSPQYANPQAVPPVGTLGTDAADTSDRFLSDAWDDGVYNYNAGDDDLLGYPSYYTSDWWDPYGEFNSWY